MLLEADERYQVKKNAQHDPPQGTSGELLHDRRITLAFQAQPDKHKGTGQRHDPNEAGGGEKSLPDCRGRKNDRHADYRFEKNMHPQAAPMPVPDIMQGGGR
ncbi:hypothetical protein GSbR_40810 [Geobacter sp. SVR]|nr:hypothetical protein GSVR_26580 [Geobacter sp. SVR]GCF87481.1 hypothetical protein GSbR_40810 [Geobacter sp. SVR]